MVILENIDIDIDIDKAILQNNDIDKISNCFKFGISNRASRRKLRTSLLCLWSYWTIMINAEEHVMHVPHSGIHHKMLQNFSCHIPVLLGLSATDRLKSSCRVLTDRVPIWLEKVTSSSKWVGEPDQVVTDRTRGVISLPRPEPPPASRLFSCRGQTFIQYFIQYVQMISWRGQKY